MDYEPPRIEEIRKLTPEEEQEPGWNPYKPDKWDWLSAHSEVIIIGSVVLLVGIVLLVMP